MRLALQRLTSGAAPVELRSPSAAPETLTSFSIDDLLEHLDLPHFRVQENRGRHSKSFTAESYGIVVKKGDKELLALINKGIKAVKAKKVDEQLRKKWLR
nr:transporter substrate-binding domain-containing protein [Geobacter sulfurreducens]